MSTRYSSDTVTVVRIDRPGGRRGGGLRRRRGGRRQLRRRRHRRTRSRRTGLRRWRRSRLHLRGTFGGGALQLAHDLARRGQVIGLDVVLHLLAAVRRQLVHLQRLLLVHLRQRDPGDVLVHTLEDRHVVAVGADVVLLLRPAVGQPAAATDQRQYDDQYGEPPQPGEPLRRTRRVPQLLRIERPVPAAAGTMTVTPYGDRRFAAACAALRELRGSADELRRVPTRRL